MGDQIVVDSLMSLLGSSVNMKDRFGWSLNTGGRSMVEDDWNWFWFLQKRFTKLKRDSERERRLTSNLQFEFYLLSWVSESRDLWCCLIYSAPRDQFSRLLIFLRFLAIFVYLVQSISQKDSGVHLWNVGYQSVSRMLLWCRSCLPEIV